MKRKQNRNPLSVTDLLSESDLRVAAINLLSRREYSSRELFQKLSPKAESEKTLSNVLSYLSERGYQSDERFAGSFFRSRVSRGLGEIRIRRELSEKGIDDGQISSVAEQENTDWFELAVRSGASKARQLDLHDFKDRQKFFRYLAYRGFSMDEIRYAVETHLSDRS